MERILEQILIIGPADQRADVIMDEEIWAQIDDILKDFNRKKRAFNPLIDLFLYYQVRERIQKLFPPPPAVPQNLNPGIEE